jgi:hypothetical protein
MPNHICAGVVRLRRRRCAEIACVCEARVRGGSVSRRTHLIDRLGRTYNHRATPITQVGIAIGTWRGLKPKHRQPVAVRL